MGIVTRIKAAADAFRHPRGAGGYAISLPGSRRDWSEALEQPWKSSAAAIGVDWVARSFPEAVFAVARDADGQTEYDRAHPLAALIRRPNAAYGGRKLWQATVLSLLCDGNAYWILQRNAGGTGRVVAMWYAPHWMVEPRALSDTSYIDAYAYSPAGMPIPIPAQNVVHLRYGIDPEDIRKGLGPLRAQGRALGLDNEVGTFSYSIVKNMGIVGVLASEVDSEGMLDEKAFDSVAAKIKQSTGDGRGRTVVLSGPVKIQEFGATPEKLALDKLERMPAQRILGALHLDPMVVGLSLEHSTYNNMSEAVRGAWDNAVLPLMAECAEEVEQQLGPEFGVGGQTRCAFDTTGVQALQDDVDKRHLRARSNYVAGIWTRAEARTETGKDSKPEDEQYRQVGAAGVGGDGPNGPDGPNGQAGKRLDWGRRARVELDALRGGQVA